MSDRIIPPDNPAGVQAPPRRSRAVFDLRWAPPVTRTTEEHQIRLTPLALVRELEVRYGRGRFDRDAACTSDTCVVCRLGRPCDRHPVDSLCSNWRGSVFCNPPWNRIEPFVCRGIQSVVSGAAVVVVFLLPARMASPWVHTAQRNGGRFYPIAGRVAYGGSGSSPFEASIVLVVDRPVEAAEFKKTQDDERGGGGDQGRLL